MSAKISLGVVKFKEENADQEEELEFHLLSDYHILSRVTAVAWSPDTSLGVLPKLLSLAAAGADFSVHLITADLADRTEVEVLRGHSGYVNVVAFDPNGGVLASGSDDQTVKLWEKGSCVATICVASPVVALCWHRNEPSKLLVAEQDGVVRLYNSQTQRALVSLSTDEHPLSEIHWSPSNSNCLAAVASKYLILWDLSNPSRNDNVRALYGDAARTVRFCPTNHQLIATIGEPKHELKVTHTLSKSSLLATPCKIYGGIAWHNKLPYVCVSIDRKLCFWKVAAK